MAWTYNTTVIREGRSWTNDAGITHPYNWAVWSDESKTAAGLVWEDPAPWFDPRFYWAESNPKDLAKLQEDWVSMVKSTTHSNLSHTDWYIIRNAEEGTAIPSDVSAYRSATRAYSATIEGQINSVADHDGFVALVTSASFGDWPKLEDYAV